MTRICIINPVTNREFEKIDSAQLSKHIPAGVEMTISSIGRGPASIESHLDEALAIPGILELVREVQTKADAIVLNCFGDPGVEAAREISRIPIIGPGSTSMVFATLYGFRFSVITVLKQLEPYLTDMAVKLGIDKKLASIRSVEIPVLELHPGSKQLQEILVEESIKAIEKDKAHVIVLGCTSMSSVRDEIHQALSSHNYDVPVIDPMSLALKVAILSVELGLTHSLLTYPLYNKTLDFSLGID